MVENSEPDFFRDLSKNSDKLIKVKVQEWVDKMFTFTKDGEANINSVMLYTPLNQWANNELTSRYIKRTNRIAIGISVLVLVVALAALVVTTSP